MIESKSHLFLFSSSYPYGQEPFLENELNITKSFFKQVHLIPINKKSDKKGLLPDQFVVHDVLLSLPGKTYAKTIFKNLGLIIKVLFLEFLNTNEKKYFLKNIRKFNSILCQGIQKAELVERIVGSPEYTENVFYSYWMNDGALICAILKAKKKIPDFIFRVHGFDLYDERRKGNYMPFRYFNMKMAKAIYTVSEAGFQYLKQKNIFSEKVKLNRLGVFDHGINPFDENNVFTIVSCSNLIPLKRVHLIIEALKQVKFPLKWIHIGGGYLMEELLEKAKSLPPTVQYEFKGAMKNENVMDYYKKNSINLFILLSETEGGVSLVLQEAASFGIPLLGTNTGGIPEIVNENTGVLVEKEISPEDVAEAIIRFKASTKNTIVFRVSVRKYWREHFNATDSYNKFYNEMLRN